MLAGAIVAGLLMQAEPAATVETRSPLQESRDAPRLGDLFGQEEYDRRHLSLGDGEIYVGSRRDVISTEQLYVLLGDRERSEALTATRRWKIGLAAAGATLLVAGLGSLLGGLSVNVGSCEAAITLADRYTCGTQTGQSSATRNSLVYFGVGSMAVGAVLGLTAVFLSGPEESPESLREKIDAYNWRLRQELGL